MLSSSQVKYIQSLKQKKFREINRQFLAEGAKLVTEILEGSYPLHAVYAIHEWLIHHEHVLLSKKIPFTEISEREMERITALSSPSQVLAILEIPESSVLPLGINDLVLVLDEIKDPGNLGTIIRIADWFGINSIICSENTVDLYNPKVIQATMGSFVRVNVGYFNIPGFLSSIDPSIKIYGTFKEGENIYSEKLDSRAIIVIGSESFGISAEVHEKITHRISIPSFSSDKNKNHAESLNASIATAIVCSEFRRRKE